MSEQTNSVITLALRGLVAFPGVITHFTVGRKASVNAIKAATRASGEIFLVTQKDVDVENPELDSLYKVGVIAQIKQAAKAPDSDDIYRVVVEGKYRAELKEVIRTKPFIKSVIEKSQEKPLTQEDFLYSQALLRNVMQSFSDYYAISHSKLSPNTVNDIFGSHTPGELSDRIAGNIFFPYEEKQELLEELDTVKRLERTAVIVAQEVKIAELDENINRQVHDNMDKNQNDYYLREQLKVIYEELGEGEEPEEEKDKYLSLIKKSLMPDDLKEKLYKEVYRFGKLQPSSPDSGVIRTYLDKCLALPWGIYTKESVNLEKICKQLDKDHYGLKDVKERITEMMAVRIQAPDIKGQIICLAGPPGVGKTSIAKSIAKAIGRNYQRVALGGVHDEAEIRGHRRTYIGAIPGRIINAVTDAGSSNPLILLDEIDKLNGDFKGDPASALLEVLDAEQNNTYTDHYIDLPFDLSKVLFITTANDKYSIPAPLLDRMEIIDVTSYTHEEKFNIAKKHLIPKQMKQHNISKTQIKISDKGLRAIIDGYTKESGVRGLERQIAKICRKTAMAIVGENQNQISVTDKNIEEFLGPVKFREEDMFTQDSVGIVNGLAWTSVGGEMLQIETAVLEGTGKVELTGSLGDVMKESAMTALSLVRSRSREYSIDTDFYKTKDIHIHVPEGAVPKDGPSAGITMTTCLMSALTGKKVNGKVAMTGEITLRGRVLPIGGLKEKSMAAYRHGMKKVIIPKGNEADIAQIDDAVKNNVEFIPVTTIDEVFKNALI